MQQSPPANPATGQIQSTPASESIPLIPRDGVQSTTAAPNNTQPVARPAPFSSMTDYLPLALVLSGVVMVVMSVLKHRRKKALQTEREILSAAQGVRALRLRPSASPADPASTDDLQDLTESAIARLDDKVAVLQRLLKDADAKIARLERLASGAPGHSTVAAAGSSKNFAPHDHDDPLTPGVDALTRDIYRLADEGFTPLMIAQRLGQHVGHVGLVLALRR